MGAWGPPLAGWRPPPLCEPGRTLACQRPGQKLESPPTREPPPWARGTRAGAGLGPEWEDLQQRPWGAPRSIRCPSEHQRDRGGPEENIPGPLTRDHASERSASETHSGPLRAQIGLKQRDDVFVTYYIRNDFS